MKSKKWVLGWLLSLILCSSIAFNIGQKVDGETSLTAFLEYGDQFDDIDLFNMAGERCKLNIESQKYSIVFYLSNSCNSCKRQLLAVKNLLGIVNKSEIKVNIVWDKEIEYSQLKKYGIDRENCYSLKGTKLNTSVPAVYILDDKNRIVFITTEPESFAKKFFGMDGIDKNKMQIQAINYLKNLSKNKNSKKRTVIYFGMDGCSDCEEVDNAVLNEQEVKDKVDLIRIYDSDAYGKYENIDVDSIFLELFNIEWYPSFLIIHNNEFELIEEVLIDDLKGLLIG